MFKNKIDTILIRTGYHVDTPIGSWSACKMAFALNNNLVNLLSNIDSQTEFILVVMLQVINCSCFTILYLLASIIKMLFLLWFTHFNCVTVHFQYLFIYLQT